MSVPWAAYDQPSREKSGGASTSGSDQATVAARTRARTRPAPALVARAALPAQPQPGRRQQPEPDEHDDQAGHPAGRGAAQELEQVDVRRCRARAGRVATTSPPSSTSTLPTTPRATTLADA